MNQPKAILDLCGGSGSWSEPYHDAGYSVMIVDPASLRTHSLQNTVEEFFAYGCVLPGGWQPGSVHGILAAPPCTHFANSGRKHFSAKDSRGVTMQAVLTVKACLSIINFLKPVWWCLENPVGRMRNLVPEVGPVQFTFDPCDFGDPTVKRTQLFGKFTIPTKRPVAPILGSMVQHTGKGDSALRAVTPPGFAKAFFEANP